jgi:hypothetical protein
MRPPAGPSNSSLQTSVGVRGVVSVGVVSARGDDALPPHATDATTVVDTNQSRTPRRRNVDVTTGSHRLWTLAP